MKRELSGRSAIVRNDCAGVVGSGADVALTNPDRETDIRLAADQWTPESLLRRLEAVLACRSALDANVKPEIAVEAMMTVLHRG